MPLSTRLFSTEKATESHVPSKSTNLYIPLSAAHAGIDRRHHARPAMADGFPAHQTIGHMACQPNLGFPAHAGIDPVHAEVVSRSARFPRPRGDRPWYSVSSSLNPMVSPPALQKDVFSSTHSSSQRTTAGTVPRPGSPQPESRHGNPPSAKLKRRPLPNPRAQGARPALCPGKKA